MENISKLIQGIGTLLIGIALIWGIGVGASSLSNGLQGNTISVTGKATRAFTPNQSVVSGTWEERAKTSDEARSKVKDNANKGLDAIKAKGVDSKKITTENVSVNPNYDWSSGKQSIIDYRASTTISVTLDDTAKANEIISTMTGNGASSTSGPSLGFTTATRDQLEKDLKLEAVTDAKGQATALAGKAGSKIGKVVSITSGGASYPTPERFYATALSADSASTKSVSSDINVGDKEVSMTISVTYRLK